MRKPNLNPELLKEELNRFKLLNEYSFYKESKPQEDDLLLGGLAEVDEDPAAPDASGDIANELGITPPEGDAGVPPAPDANGGMPPAEPNPANAEDPVAPEAPLPAEPAQAPLPAADEEEIDVTSLVNSTDEAKEAALDATQNTQMLMQKLEDLEARIASMDAVSGKIEDLEKEIIKRNPTPVEKLEMRSLSSFPYSQKLTDYWAEKHGPYDVMGKDKPEEYVLDKDAVDSDYSESEIKKSFGVKDTDYEEEDI
jgi:hypothetical protein